MGWFDFSYIRYLITKSFSYLRRYKYVLIGLYLLCAFLFFFSRTSFGYSADDNYQLPKITGVNTNDVVMIPTTNSRLLETASLITATQAYKSGQYYYWVSYAFTSDTQNVIGLMFKKSSFDNILVEMVAKVNTLNSKNNVTVGLPFAPTSSDMYSSYWKDGVEYPSKNTAWSSSGLISQSRNLYVYPSSYSNNNLEVPFATDIPYQITYNNASGAHVFYEGANRPYIANTELQLAKLVDNTVNVVTNGATQVQLSLINLNTGNELFTINVQGRRL